MLFRSLVYATADIDFDRRPKSRDLRSDSRCVFPLHSRPELTAELSSSSVMATIIKDFDLTFAPGYLENVEMLDCAPTPRYQDSLTLPMVRCSLLLFSPLAHGRTPARPVDGDGD